MTLFFRGRPHPFFNNQPVQHPFGGFRGSDPAFLTERAFTGHKANNTGSNDLGLIYMNARYYVGSIGRFASADTLVPDQTDPQALNRYAYARNNPVRFSDATGHCASEQFDTECWVQYDALFNQFLLNNYSEEDILELIGTGENYRFKEGKGIVSIFDRYRNCGSDFDCSNNAPRPWDPYENTCGWQYWTDCYEPVVTEEEIGPDAVIFPGVSGSAAGV